MRRRWFMAGALVIGSGTAQAQMGTSVQRQTDTAPALAAIEAAEGAVRAAMARLSGDGAASPPAIAEARNALGRLENAAQSLPHDDRSSFAHSSLRREIGEALSAMTSERPDPAMVYTELDQVLTAAAGLRRVLGAGPAVGEGTPNGQAMPR